MKRSFTSCREGLFALAALAIAVDYGEAQTTPAAGTVQLPTFHQFGVSTTVVVPAGGRSYLGGVGHARLGQGQYGLPLLGRGNRGLGRSLSAGGISMSATIIDHSAIDRALLAEAARQRGARFDIRGRPVAEAPGGSPAVSSARAASAHDGRDSLAPPRPRHSVGSSTSVAESQRAQTYLKRAQRADAAGQPHLAKVFYQRVVKHGSARLKQRAEARIADIGSQASGSGPSSQSFSFPKVVSP